MNKLIVFSNCKEGRDDDFNRWYDEIHVREVIEQTPVAACQRFRLSDEQITEAGPFRYVAIYEFEGDPKPVLEALGKAKFDMGDTLTDTEVRVIEAL